MTPLLRPHFSFFIMDEHPPVRSLPESAMASPVSSPPLWKIEGFRRGVLSKPEDSCIARAPNVLNFNTNCFGDCSDPMVFPQDKNHPDSLLCGSTVSLFTKMAILMYVLGETFNQFTSSPQLKAHLMWEATIP